jgi:hypothetical protein
METGTKMGMNRTGIQSSPFDVDKLLEASQNATPSAPGSEAAMADVRRTYIEEADRIGSVPPPGSLKGAVKTGIQVAMGKRPHVLIDKLAERLAFERTGTRLYESLIVKHEATPGVPVPIEKLREIHDEEAQHMLLVAEAIRALGGDPTAQTPAADVVAIESAGLVQTIAEPRTTFAQSLHAILVAELADNDGWVTLITVARAEGQEDMAKRFEAALANEEDHLAHVRQWLSELTLAESTVGGGGTA